MERQRAWFQNGHTLPVEFRLQALRRLKAAVERREADISAALQADLGKSGFESYMCEIGMVRSELSHMLRHTPRYARERTVPTPLAQFPSRSFVKPSPKGVVLIMSPWNYPFLLTIGPLIDALAAGCTAVVKPSAYSPATSAVMAELLSECFPPEHVFPVTGGRAENQRLLDQKFDHIFFTGSQAVGKEVLRRAAEHLTPVTLELGGKSPCIVDETADLALAARRIVFGKFLAAFGVYFVANTLALLPALTMSMFASAFPWGLLLGNYFGTLLYGAAMISIGVFISSLTISQVIAAIGTFVIAVLLMFIDQIASALSGNIFGTILTWISFTSRYDTFTQGVFSISSCVYFISVAAVFVFLTARKVESRRWN